MSVTDKKINRAAMVGRKTWRVGPPINGLIMPCTLSINADPTKFDVSNLEYILNGEWHHEAAQTAIVFSAIHATGIAKWLGVIVFVDGNGTITTKGVPDTGDQDHATEAAALAAAATIAYQPGKIPIGYITLLTNAADWDANTDALNAADLLAANLIGYPGRRRWSQFQPGHGFQVDVVRPAGVSVSGTAHIEVVTPNGSTSGLITDPRIRVDRHAIANTAVTKLYVGEFDYALDGVVYRKDAEQAIAFTAAHLVSLDKWGAIKVLVNAAGVISTLVGEATQTTAMAYADSAAALAALPATPAGYVHVATVVIEADGSTWTANTDDLVAASDLEAFDLLPQTQDRLLGDPTLAIQGGEAEDFKCAAFDFVVDGIKYSKAAATGIDFTVAHVVTASKYLAILVEINPAGTVATKVPLISGRSQTSAQGFDTKQLALDAVPPVTPGKVAMGLIVILADAGGWTANTDDMTDGSDLTSAEFVSYQAAINEIFAVEGAVFTAARLTAVALGPAAARRGHEDGVMVAYIAGTDGHIGGPDLFVDYRPYPMNQDTGN